MDGLISVIRELSRVRTLPEIIQIVRTAARKATGADGATFVLKDEGYCYYVDEDAIGPLWKGKRFPLSACISGWTMLHKEPVAIPDIFKDPRIPVEAYQPTFVRSLAMVPIRKDDPIAAIGNYWATNHLATEQELSVLQALADVTAVAMENVQLYDSLESRINELESVNRAKNELLLIVSHELRTPLNSILGWSEILSKYESEPEDRQAGLEAIYRNAQAQLRVVDSLLDASSIVLGKFHILESELDLVPLVNDVINQLRPQAEKKMLRLNYRCLLNEAPMLGDSTRLRQAVYNLLDNAIKYTPADGQVHVEIYQEGPSVTLRIQDSGEGIDFSSNRNIFSFFSQEEHHLTRRHGGLGLGLTVTKSIVEAHHGKIAAKSAGLNQGSEFSIYLPLINPSIRTILPRTGEANSPCKKELVV